MCFNLSLVVRREKAASIFGIDPGRDWGPGFLLSGFDHPQMPVLAGFTSPVGFLEATWGLIPPWAVEKGAKDLQMNTLNARGEEMWNNPSFREAAEKYRVLIPFTGFFEWKSSSSQSIPYYFRFQNDDLGALAGLASPLPDSSGSSWTFTLVTGPPNDLVRPIHHRSPVRLFPDQWKAWLDPASTKAELMSMVENRPWPDMEAYPVGPLISQKNKNRNVPEVIVPRQIPPEPVDGQLGLF